MGETTARTLPKSVVLDMLTIGLTGGIGSGKSTVANIFSKQGVPILDADIIAREIVMPGKPALEEIITHFGKGILNADGTLNRQQLRSIIFSNPLEKQWLEHLLHPLIREQFKQQLSQLTASYCILVIPLLLETQRAISVDRVLIVDTSPETQIKRLQLRDKLTRDEAVNILKQQMSRQERNAGADDFIYNDSEESYHALEQQVEKLHKFYLALAAPQ